MRHKRTIAAHVEERVADAATICDGCGRDVDHTTRMYHSEEATISALIGDVYPEGDHRTSYEVDVCGECFVAKVVPALASVGLKARARGVEEDGRVWETAEGGST